MFLEKGKQGKAGEAILISRLMYTYMQAQENKFCRINNFSLTINS